MSTTLHRLRRAVPAAVALVFLALPTPALAVGEPGVDGGLLARALPAAPSNLRAAALSSTRVRLAWQDNSDDETGFALFLRHAWSGELVEIPVEIPAEKTVVLLSGLTPNTRYTFRVKARNDDGLSPSSNPATVDTFADPGCVVTSFELCLLAGRFRLSVRFRDPQTGDELPAVGIPSTDRTGLFWFFGPDNLELIVKMLDGRALNGHFWFFSGGLSNLEYRVIVTDLETGEVREYENPAGEICGHADVEAFDDLADPASVASPAGVAGAGEVAAITARVVPSPPRPRSGDAPPAAGSCVPGPKTLCLLDRRLRVEVSWLNPHAGGGEGVGQAVAAGDRSGEFWFFFPEATDLVVKAIDGGNYDGYLWFFWGALTDVEYSISVTDTATGASRVYHNPPGHVCGGADTRAFPSAP